jgi:xanthine dehydrogenase molybdopterin-binding subunit B
MSGVLAFVDASDVPGKNYWQNVFEPEPIFTTGRSEYAGQAIGLIVAETREIAIAAAKKVKVTYDKFGTVVTDIEVAMEDPANVSDASNGFPMEYGQIDTALENADVVVSGRFKMGSQYHFHMETHVCISKPTDDGFELEIPTQDMGTCADSVAKALNLPINR